MIATVELDHEEIMTLLQLAHSRKADLARMIESLEEGEGMDLQRHNALKTLRPQAEAIELLVLKLEGASRELARKR